MGYLGSSKVVYVNIDCFACQMCFIDPYSQHNTFGIPQCIVVRRIKGPKFDSRCWSCVKALGKLLIPHCFGLLSRDGYPTE